MFRLGKRSREEDADAASLDVRVPASALLNAVLRWRHVFTRRTRGRELFRHASLCARARAETRVASRTGSRTSWTYQLTAPSCVFRSLTESPARRRAVWRCARAPARPGRSRARAREITRRRRARRSSSAPGTLTSLSRSSFA